MALLILFFLIKSAVGSSDLIYSNTSKPFVMGVGSCFNGVNGFYFDIFKDVINDKPDVWMWLGDFAYVDKRVKLVKTVPREEEDRRKYFESTYNNEFYSILRKSTKIIGMWDDHDYGLNNAGRGNPIKVENKRVFLDYIDEPQDSERRKRPDS